MEQIRLFYSNLLRIREINPSEDDWAKPYLSWYDKVFIGFRSIFSLFITVLFIGLPIAALVLGSLYVNDCPNLPFIPIYSIIMGILLIILFIVVIILSTINPLNYPKAYDSLKKLLIVILVANAIWFMSGIVLLFFYFGNYPDFTDKSSKKYCSKIIYDYAFWIILIPSIGLVIACTLGGVGYCMSTKS